MRTSEADAYELRGEVQRRNDSQRSDGLAPLADGPGMDCTSRDTIKRDLLARGRHPATVEVAQWFAFGHLPEGSPRKASKTASVLATAMILALPDSPELTAGLRKLLEAKDCFVRAAIAAVLPDEASSGWRSGMVIPVSYQGPARHTYTPACDGFHESEACPTA